MSSLILLSGACSASSLEERVKALETEIDNIKSAIAVLYLASASNKKGDEIKTEVMSDQWKDISNWRKLSTGMTYADVESLLGKPEVVNGGKSATWRYGNGFVSFWKGEVDQWSEPN